METNKAYHFILFVLLQEGKSNLPFRFLCFVMGRKQAMRMYSPHLFRYMDEATRRWYRERFEGEY